MAMAASVRTGPAPGMPVLKPASSGLWGRACRRASLSTSVGAAAGGGEAVEFFQRSGLNKEPLFQVCRPDRPGPFLAAVRRPRLRCAKFHVVPPQIWNAVANNSPYLSKQQFYTAMRLVSAAQVWETRLCSADCMRPDFAFFAYLRVQPERLAHTAAAERRRKAVRGGSALHPHRVGAGAAAADHGGP